MERWGGAGGACRARRKEGVHEALTRREQAADESEAPAGEVAVGNGALQKYKIRGKNNFSFFDDQAKRTRRGRSERWRGTGQRNYTMPMHTCQGISRPLVEKECGDTRRTADEP
jgi:hypothetical protein